MISFPMEQLTSLPAIWLAILFITCMFALLGLALISIILGFMHEDED